jgi:hypothetical protein
VARETLDQVIPNDMSELTYSEIKAHFTTPVFCMQSLNDNKSFFKLLFHSAYDAAALENIIHENETARFSDLTFYRKVIFQNKSKDPMTSIKLSINDTFDRLHVDNIIITKYKEFEIKDELKVRILNRNGNGNDCKLDDRPTKFHAKYICDRFNAKEVFITGEPTADSAVTHFSVCDIYLFGYLNQKN